LQDIKIKSEKVTSSGKRYGGNRKPQTFRKCIQCDEIFGPLQRLSARFCSQECKIKAQTTGRKTFRKTTDKARSAQRMLIYHVNKGSIVRPKTCDSCGCNNKRIEGAHKDYSRPLDVRWLCRSCHVKWDKEAPKNATYIVKRWEDFTGKTAELMP